MRISGVFDSCKRIAICALLTCLISSALVIIGTSISVTAQSASEADSGASSVQIAARKLSNGKVEFGLRLAGSELWLPNARFFDYETVDVNRWLRSSAYTMTNDHEVRIRARKLNNGKVEFALQVGSNRQWLPSVRMFPYRTATVGQWLYSSQYSVGDATTQLDTSSSTSTGTTPTNKPDCTFEQALEQVAPSVFEVVAEERTGTTVKKLDFFTEHSLLISRGTWTGTAFYIGNNEFLTTARVVEGVKTIRLQNDDHTLRQVRLVGLDPIAGLAILRANGSGIEPVRFGDESALNLRAPVAVVGYTGDISFSNSSASMVKGSFAEKVSGLSLADNNQEMHFLTIDDAEDWQATQTGGPLITKCGEVIGLSSWYGWAVSEKIIQEVLRRPRQILEPPLDFIGFWYPSYDEDGEKYHDYIRTDTPVFVYARPQRNQHPPNLAISCDEDELWVYVGLPGAYVIPHDQTGEVKVEYQFLYHRTNPEQFVTESWYGVDNQDGAFAINSRRLVNSILILEVEAILVILRTVDSKVAGAAVFELAGLEEALKQLSCY